MARILPVGEKVALAAGSGSATTVGNATVVRIVATAGDAVVVRTDSSDTVIGSFTQLNNTVEYVEKYAPDKIYVTGNAVEVSAVGFTN
jgi:phosphosulfolactate phosphohydrolase-like enzyme